MNFQAPITIALSKGRIFEQTLPLLAHAGLEPADDPELSRKLILETNHPQVKLLIIRATDVPTYVQWGAADMGVAGKDVLLEHGGEGLYEPSTYTRPGVISRTADSRQRSSSCTGPWSWRRWSACPT